MARMDVSQARKLKVLEGENEQLKRLLAGAMLDNAVLKERLPQKRLGRPTVRRRAVKEVRQTFGISERRACCAILKIGARWRHCPPEYGPYTTIYHHWSRQSVWFEVFEALTGYSGVWGASAIDSTSIKVHRSAAGAKGGFAQGIGTSRGGRISKIHRLTDAAGRPRILLISPGNISDMTMAPALIEAARGRFNKLIADLGCDSNAIRAAIQTQGVEVVIPATRSRRAPIP